MEIEKNNKIKINKDHGNFVFLTIKVQGVKKMNIKICICFNTCTFLLLHARVCYKANLFVI